MLEIQTAPDAAPLSPAIILLPAERRAPAPSARAIPLGRSQNEETTDLLVTDRTVASPRPTTATTPASRTHAEEAAIRLFDLTLAACAIVAFFPLLILITSAIRLTSPGPVLFKQERIGRDGKVFRCLKFRSMVCNAGEILDELLRNNPDARAEWARDQKLRNDPRITRVGQFLRKSSLDELPQLFNVLLGQMGVVGPRPIIAQEIPRYGQHFAGYTSVRPGITGLWQVSGRNDLPYETRVRLDTFYARRKSLGYDLSICLRTIPAVLQSKGTY